MESTNASIAAYFEALIDLLRTRSAELTVANTDAAQMYLKELAADADVIEINQALLHTCASFARQEVERESGRLMAASLSATPSGSSASASASTSASASASNPSASASSASAPSSLSVPGKAATHAERILLLNKVKDDLVQKLAHASNPVLHKWPLPFLSTFVVAAAPAAVATHYLGDLFCSPILLANALIDGELCRRARRTVRLGERIELRVQLRDTALRPAPVAGWQWTGALRATSELAAPSIAAMTPFGSAAVSTAGATDTGAGGEAEVTFQYAARSILHAAIQSTTILCDSESRL